MPGALNAVDGRVEQAMNTHINLWRTRVVDSYLHRRPRLNASVAVTSVKPRSLPQRLADQNRNCLQTFRRSRLQDASCFICLVVIAWL